MAAGKQFLKGLMDNPNFQKWFGESVVRDAEGLPLEVYHGTGRPGFSAFDPALAGKNEKADFGKGAGYFTDDSALASGYAMKRGDGGGVVPGYVNISNPYVIYQDKVSRGWEPPENFVDDLKAQGHDGITVKLRDMDESTGEVFDEFFEEVVPFSPTQFKSRFNAGTFNPSDPNFLKSAGLMTAGAGVAAYGMSPDDAEAARIPKFLDFGDVKLPIDAKGMATLYHATSPEAADNIVSSKMLKSAGEPSVYFSTSKEGTGYGPAVVEAKVPGSMLQMDDVFPDGRADFRVDKSTLPLSYVKRIAGLGLTGAGAYGLMGSDSDADAMSYIGPKGLANLLGPDAAKKLLTDAEQMAAKGVDNEAVRQATGMFKGMDGKWRFEVDDTASQALRPQYPPNFMNQAAKEAGFSSYIDIPMAERKPINARADQLKSEYADPFSTFSAMSNHFKHDDLYKAYPELADAPTRVDSTARRNGVTYSDGSIEYGGGSIGGDGDRPTLLHELQHAIQQQEGFARGGSPSEFTQVDDAKLARDALAFRRELDKMPAGMDSLAKENAIVKDYQDMDAMDFLPSREARDLAHDRDYNPDDQLTELVKAYGLDKHVDMTPKRAYDWLAGEIEARDTAARMNLTPEQRRATPPDLRDNAIVRFDGGQAASVPQSREWAKDAGSSTPNVAQAVAPSDPFTPSPSRLASTAALVAALKSKDAPLEDTYQPADLLTAFATGGGGFVPRAIQAGLDPIFSAGVEYLPRVADAINPRNIVMGLMR